MQFGCKIESQAKCPENTSEFRQKLDEKGPQITKLGEEICKTTGLWKLKQANTEIMFGDWVEQRWGRMGMGWAQWFSGTAGEKAAGRGI